MLLVYKTSLVSSIDNAMIGPKLFLSVTFFATVSSVQPGYSAHGRGRGGSYSRPRGRGDGPTPARTAPIETVDPSSVRVVPENYVSIVLNSSAGCADVLTLLKAFNPALFPNPRVGPVNPIDLVHASHGAYCQDRSVCDATFKCTYHYGWRGCSRKVIQLFLQGPTFKMRCKANKYPFVKGGAEGKPNAKVGCWEKDEVEKLIRDQQISRTQMQINIARKEKMKLEAGMSGSDIASTSRLPVEIDDRERPFEGADPTSDTIEGVEVTGSMCVDLPGSSADVPSWAGQTFDLTPYLLLDPPIDQPGKP